MLVSKHLGSLLPLHLGRSFSQLRYDWESLALSTFQFPRIVFGSSSMDQIPNLATLAKLTKVVIIQDEITSSNQRSEFLQFLLLKANIPSFSYTMQHPTASLNDVNKGLELAQRVGANGVIGLGGGRVMDTTRAIAAMMSNSGNAEDYLVVRFCMKKLNNFKLH